MTDSNPENTNSETLTDTVGSGPIAAIDIGSNSFHLITARINNGALQPLVKDKQIVRLADGLNEDGLLTEDAIERGIKVLQSFAKTIADIPAESVRVVGTFTLRRARNAHEFLRRARDFMPVPVEIISGEEEARLIYQGVAHTIHHDGQRLAIDIGGGSTEFIIGKGFSILQLSSQPLGCVVFTKRYFSDGAITEDSFKRTQLAVEQRLEAIYRRFLSTGWDVALGSSGTIKAIALYLEANHKDFDGKITLSLLIWMRQQFINKGHTKELLDVDENRRAVLPAGLGILIAIFELLEIEELSVSDGALREGVLYELPDRMRHHDIRQRTVDSLVQRYDVDTAHTKRVQKTVDQLFLPLSKYIEPHRTDTANDFLHWAVSLHEIGLQINRRGIHRHSAYIVENAGLPGFSTEEQSILAVLLDGHRKRFDHQDFKQFELMDRQTLLWLVVVLRLAVLLNIRRLDEFLPAIKFAINQSTLRLTFPDGWLKANALVVEDLKSESEMLRPNGITLSWDSAE